MLMMRPFDRGRCTGEWRPGVRAPTFRPCLHFRFLPIRLSLPPPSGYVGLGFGWNVEEMDYADIVWGYALPNGTSYIATFFTGVSVTEVLLRRVRS